MWLGLYRALFPLSQMRAQLQTLGPAGLLSYGLLNCVYYTVGVLVVYCWVGKAPAGELGVILLATKSFRHVGWLLLACACMPD